MVFPCQHRVSHNYNLPKILGDGLPYNWREHFVVEIQCRTCVKKLTILLDDNTIWIFDKDDRDGIWKKSAVHYIESSFNRFLLMKKSFKNNQRFIFR